MRFTNHLAVLAGLSVLTLTALGCGSKAGTDAVTASISGDTVATSESPAAPKPALPPRYKIHTTLGDLTIELDVKNAPLTCDNFMMYVARGHYDNTLFHQVERGFIALGGGYDTKMQERPTDASIRNEAHNGLKNTRGTIAMAREFEVVDGAHSQFFFNLADNPALDHRSSDAEGYGYCVFGKLVGGMDILDQLGMVAVADTDQFVKKPVEPVVIESVTRVQ